MDYGKLDGALAMALGRGSSRPERLTVFIRIAPELADDAKSLLESYGFDTSGELTAPVSADLRPDEIANLSEQPWVTSIRLARTLRPLMGD